MKANANSINWFEISVADIKRATKFYEAIFNIEMGDPFEMMGMMMTFFPSDPKDGKAHGGLCQSDMHTPSVDGVKIYLNGDPDLQQVLDRIEAAGGKITMPKTDLGENGFMAFFDDTEGNSIGLHSNA